MIFRDLLEERHELIRPEFNRLLDEGWKNQAHIGDLLLSHLNGFFQEDIINFNSHSETKFDPHTIGPGFEGFSENTHYRFIHKYRTTSIVDITHREYLEQLRNIPGDKKPIEEIEETTIQIEMLIYLKIWEADLFIKKIYQFVRCLNGEPYDWHFKIAESSRDRDCTGTRQELIRNQISKKIDRFSPTLHSIIRDTYKTQIRNSIAHSNYSIIGRSIHLNNYLKEDPHSQLGTISFDDWINIFHNTITLYNEYLRINNLINDMYAKLVLEHENTMEILITKTNGDQYPLYIEYRPTWKDWKFKN